MKKNHYLLANILLILLALVFLSPLYIVVVNSFKNRAEMNLNVLGLPSSFDFQYYQRAIERMQFPNAFMNSVIIAVCSILFIIVLTSMTAWRFVRVPNKLSMFLFFLFVATMIIPFQAIMMPLMQFMGWIQEITGIRILNTRGGLIYMYIGFGVGMSVFLYHGFIKSIPVSLEEAATIDGCNTWQVFWRIVFPMLKSITVTVVILDIIWIWNDFLLPSLVLSAKRLRTIPLSTYSFFGEFTIMWNMAMAGLMMTMIPVILFYIFSQKYIIKGMASGAVK
ncbi:MAG: carbohydrate ABC transporter permease [Treponema sp.]|jgi:raffinose/stachyose/melibiose transport system permease protein|nr:carbohydrate ABC transporter permease [Treponema sp.]